MKRTTRRRGEKEYTYLSLVESVRVNGKKTHQTLLRLGEIGELERSGQLDRIVAALSGYTTKHFVAAEGLEGEGAPSFGATAAISAYFDRLGLREHFARDRRQAALEEPRRHDLRHGGEPSVRSVLQAPHDPRMARDRRASRRRRVTAARPVLSGHRRDRRREGGDRRAPRTARLTDLTNLDLRLALYDLTSTYFETSRGPADEFSSRAYGYSRDHRADRPQVVIGLLVTGNGIPIAHYVFPGNTRDSTTLQQVMADYQSRFGVGRIALVADRGLITEQNLADVASRPASTMCSPHDSTTTATSPPCSSAPQLSATTRGARCRALRERRPSR